MQIARTLMSRKAGDEDTLLFADAGAQIALPPIRIDLFLASHAHRLSERCFHATQSPDGSARKNFKPDKGRNGVSRQANEWNIFIIPECQWFSGAHVHPPELHLAV